MIRTLSSFFLLLLGDFVAGTCKASYRLRIQKKRGALSVEAFVNSPRNAEPPIQLLKHSSELQPIIPQEATCLRKAARMEFVGITNLRGRHITLPSTFLMSTKHLHRQSEPYLAVPLALSCRPDAILCCPVRQISDIDSHDTAGGKRPHKFA